MTTSRRITLVRHGRSSHHHDGRWYTPATLSHFEAAYNAAGIRDDSAPDAELLRMAADADIIAASDMIRAIASAERLAPGRPIAVSPLLREIELEAPRWWPLPLPILGWDIVSHLKVSTRMALDLEHEFTRRARDAAAWLADHASSAERVVAVTHGGFRRLLTRQLIRTGWRRAGSHSSYANWSAWMLERR